MVRVRLWAGFGVVLTLACVDFFSPTWPDTPTHLPTNHAEMLALATSQPARSRAEAEAKLATFEEIDPREPFDGDAFVRSTPICVASHGWSFGALGKTVLYRFRRDSGRLYVGYFVYWSTERPWGASGLSPVPAFFADAFYSHFLFVFPGLQRLLYGAGDVEGVRVTYEKDKSGWVPIAITADDGRHHETALEVDESVDEQGRIVVMSNVWSHQLGAPGAVQAVRGGALTTCFDGAGLRPLTVEVAKAFRLGSEDHPRRAMPAWRLGAPSSAVHAGR